MAEYGIDSGKDLSRNELAQLLKELGALLYVKAKKQHNLYLIGGAVMLLRYNSRMSTRDADGDYANERYIRDCMNKVAKKNKLKPAWLNKKFKKSGSYTPAIYDYSYLFIQIQGLNIYMPNPDLLLCMKLVAYRAKDEEDIRFLVNVLRSQGIIVNKETITQWLRKYYTAYGKQILLSPRMFKLLEVI